MSRINHDSVFDAFTQRGWQLLSRCKRSNEKLDFICDQGHKHQISWNNFQQGKGCVFCAGLTVTHEQVAAAFKERGWQLLSKYERNSQKLDFICDQGHKHQITWSGVRRGHGCGVCKIVVVTHEQVEAAFSDRGWRLLSKYENCEQHLAFICNQGHRHQISWSNFKKGIGCKHCAGHVVTHEQVEAAFRERGWQLLSKYEGNKQPLEFICDRGHKYQTVWNSFKKHGCVFCAGLAVTHEQVEAAFSDRGWRLLSKYENCEQHLAFICDQGHRHQIIWSSFRQGHGCGKCSPGGYSKELPGRLYYIRFDFPDRPPLYKIGVTNRTVKARFSTEKSPYTVLLDEWHKDGSISYDKEQTLLKRYKKYQYKGPKLLESGDTECFTKDVLGLDKPMAQLPLPLDVA